jgi:hypothetical protein
LQSFKLEAEMRRGRWLLRYRQLRPNLLQNVSKSLAPGRAGLSPKRETCSIIGDLFRNNWRYFRISQVFRKRWLFRNNSNHFQRTFWFIAHELNRFKNKNLYQLTPAECFQINLRLWWLFIEYCTKLPAGIKLPPQKNLTLERFGRNSKWERQSNMTKIETPHNIVWRT